MITEQELKEKCTPEFIKWMCEYAEGFEFFNIGNCAGYRFELYKPCDNDPNVYFPLLIHRAVEGWLKIHDQRFIDIKHKEIQLVHIAYGHVFYEFKNYQPQSLTQAECAMLHCLLDIFKEQEGRDERK